jgi:hypothetical protein
MQSNRSNCQDGIDPEETARDLIDWRLGSGMKLIEALPKETLYVSQMLRWTTGRSETSSSNSGDWLPGYHSVSLCVELLDYSRQVEHERERCLPLLTEKARYSGIIVHRPDVTPNYNDTRLC